MGKEVVVTRKGQVTIPVEYRKKYGIVRGTKVLIEDIGGALIIKPIPKFEEQAGIDKGKYSVEELKRMLDEVRAQWR